MKRMIIFVLCVFKLQVLVAAAQPSIFREYDIRGIVGDEFTVEDVPEITLAIVAYLRDSKPDLKTISVGADARIHSPAIKKAMLDTLKLQGCDVIDIGTCATPVMYFSTHTLPVDAGLMITASHNPGTYNGIKINLGTASVNGPAIQKIREIYENKQFLPSSSIPGTYLETDATGQYIDFIAEAFPQLIKADVNAIFDCGNGAAGTLLPRLIEKMEWQQAFLLFAELDGTFPHHSPDPSSEKNMALLKEALTESSAQIGFGFDGDCDRMAPMTQQGRLVKGDQLLTILSKPIVIANPQSSVVFDVSSSTFLHELIKQWGGIPFISKTGVASVKRKMEETSALIGGEISCHTIFKDRYFGYDDGFYSMMRLLELLQESGNSLELTLQELPNTYSSPTYRLPCSREVCLQIISDLQMFFRDSDQAELVDIDGLRLHFPHSWAIIRPSSTEPLISMRFEGRTEKDLQELIQTISPFINRYIPFPST